MQSLPFVLKWMMSSFLIVSLIFLVSCLFLKIESSMIREMKSKFESGIDQSEQELPPFYLHFFYIGILFLVFDVEMVLSIPMIQTSMKENQWIIFWTLFLLILVLGLFIEISMDSVEWKE